LNPRHHDWATKGPTTYPREQRKGKLQEKHPTDYLININRNPNRLHPNTAPHKKKKKKEKVKRREQNSNTPITPNECYPIPHN